MGNVCLIRNNVMTRTVLFATVLLLTGCLNFYEVDPGNFYRMAQPSGKNLTRIIEDYQIETVINLRGETPEKKWWEEERAAMEASGKTWINIGNRAGRLPHRDDLRTLLDALDNAPRPILVHCQAGADRTGLASAIYQMAYMDKTPEEASKMLTLRYFHRRWKYENKVYFVNHIWEGLDRTYQDYDPCANDYGKDHYDQEKFCP